jgi:hypothetical protein
MKKNIFKFILIVIAFFAFTRCDVNDPSAFETEYVVESYLFAMEPLSEVRLSQTVPFGAAYVFEEQAVSNARVRLNRLDEEGNIDRTYVYFESERGIYKAVDNEVVLPLRAYMLEITVPDENNTVLRASTFVPDSFSVVETSADSVVFQSTAQLEVDVTQSFFPDRQTVFIFSTEALEVSFENLTPFYRDIINEEEDDLEEFRINESPLINEENYDLNPNGTLTIKLPWLAVAFFGDNRITAFAVDNNLFNFISSQNLQVMPSTLSPGEIPAVIDPIEGGTGLFGSYARVTTQVYIERP